MGCTVSEKKSALVSAEPGAFTGAAHGMGGSGSLGCGGTCSQASSNCSVQKTCGIRSVDDIKVTNSQLLQAARDGDNGLLLKALRAGAEPDTRHPMTMAPGRKAVKTVRARNCGLTPLMHAANGGYLTCAMSLLEAKASVNAEDEDGTRALHLAACSGDLDVFKALLVAGADSRAKDCYGKGSLDYLPDDIKESPKQIKRWQQIINNDFRTT